jgi:prevent-host-death family protein
LCDLYNDHMVKQLTATETKARILSLLDEVEAGEEIEITRHGRVVARLAPARGAHALRGRFAGVAMTSDDEASLFSTGEAWDAS